MTLFTVKLSDRAAQEAFLRATSQGQSVDEFVSGMIEEALASDESERLEYAASLPDDDVLAMADYQLSSAEQSRLDELLECNSEGRLNARQQSELDELMKLYHAGTIRKAIGWAEAVRRGLRNPPQL